MSEWAPNTAASDNRHTVSITRTSTSTNCPIRLVPHPLLFEETVHDEQTVAGDHAVRPVVLVLVELDRLADGRVFLESAEERPLNEILAVFLADRFNDRSRVDALMNVKGDGWNVERGALRLSSPLEGRIKVRVVSIRLRPTVTIGLGRDETNRGVVGAGLARVGVVFDLPLR